MSAGLPLREGYSPDEAIFGPLLRRGCFGRHVGEGRTEGFPGGKVTPFTPASRAWAAAWTNSANSR